MNFPSPCLIIQVSSDPLLKWNLCLLSIWERLSLVSPTPYKGLKCSWSVCQTTADWQGAQLQTWSRTLPCWAQGSLQVHSIEGGSRVHHLVNLHLNAFVPSNFVLLTPLILVCTSFSMQQGTGFGALVWSHIKLYQSFEYTNWKFWCDPSHSFLPLSLLLLKNNLYI